MSSVIITGGSAAARTHEAEKRAGLLSHGVDLHFLENPKGIEEVRKISATISRRPYESKAISVILSGVEKLTIQAQNALLKTLEDTPGGAQIFLLAEDTKNLLPTVISRCQIVNLGLPEKIVSEKDLESAWKDYHQGSLGSLFDKSHEADPAVWVELFRQVLLYKLGGEKLLNKCITPSSGSITKFVEKEELDAKSSELALSQIQSFLNTGQKTKEDLDGNVNRKLALENLFLALPQTENRK